MIDLRCHILHGLSCGPTSFEESVAMARAATADGVKTIVATPRWETNFIDPPIPFGECHRKIAALEAALKGTLSIRLGFALQFHDNLADLVNQHGANLSIGGKTHLLVSLPPLSIPRSAEVVWSDLRKLGFSILLAHPECNPAIRRDPSRLASWVASGVALQLDAQSVTGAHGRDVKRTCQEWLRKFGNNVVLASNSRPGGLSSLTEAREEISAKVGRHQATKAIDSTPQAILDGANAKHALPNYSLRTGIGSFLNSMPLFRSVRGNQ